MMKTCIENCRRGDIIYWKSRDFLTGLMGVSIFTVSEPMNEGVLMAITNDGRGAQFFPRDLIPTSGGNVVIKIVKKSKCTPV